MRLRKALRKIHRWVGLLSALWLLQLAITGLLLQHADALRLTESHVTSSTLLQWFDHGRRQQIWDHTDGPLVQIDDVVLLGRHRLHVPAPLVAAAHWDAAETGRLWVMATEQTLYGVNASGEVVFQYDDFDGLPTPVQALVFEAGHLSLASAEQWYAVSIGGEFTDSQKPIQPPVPFRPLSQAEQRQYVATALSDKLTWDKVIHGIHAGIRSSVWLNTLSGLALLYLCFSGIYLFFKPPKRKH